MTRILSLLIWHEWALARYHHVLPTMTKIPKVDQNHWAKPWSKRRR